MQSNKSMMRPIHEFSGHQFSCIVEGEFTQVVQPIAHAKDEAFPCLQRASVHEGFLKDVESAKHADDAHPNAHDQDEANPSSKTSVAFCIA